MKKYSLFVCGVFLLVGAACLTSSSDGLEIRIPTVPPFSNFVNRLTNTTFGLVRGGINIFTSTVDRIINTFSRVEDRLRQLLEEFRKLLVNGIPEFNIPILDPLHIDRIDFNVVHEAAGLKGYIQNLTVKHISKFIVDKAKFTDVGGWKFRLDLDITFPFLRADGLYDINGVIGDTFKVYGHGPFWLNLYNLSVDTSTLIKFEYPRPHVIGMAIDVKLKKLENHFDNLMNNKKNEELFNKAISALAPEALDMLWPEIKAPVQKQVIKYINNILENTTVANLARRLFNIRTI